MSTCILSIIRDCPQLREDLVNSMKEKAKFKPYVINPFTGKENRKEKTNDGTAENQSDNYEPGREHNKDREPGEASCRGDGRPCVLSNRKNMSVKRTHKNHAGRGRVCEGA